MVQDVCTVTGKDHNQNILGGGQVKPPQEDFMKEYSVHIISNDGTEEHYLGHYKKLADAKEHAKIRSSYGNRDVYVVEREVTEWKKMKTV